MSTAVAMTSEAAPIPMGIAARVCESSASMLARLQATQTVRTPASTVVTRLKDLKTSVRDQVMIDPRIIIIDDGHNPRDYNLPENHAHLDALKRSIRENGTLVPLLVRFDSDRKAAVLVDGECRLRANLELIAEGVEIEAVPTVQVSGGNESDRLLTAITANTGKPLSKWELGGAFQRLYRFGWDEDKIATKTGYRLTFITEAMELADAPEEVKRLLSAQAVTPSLALAELRANGSAAVQTLQAAAVAAKSSGQRTARLAKSLPPAKPQTANDPAPVSHTKPAKSQSLSAEVMAVLIELMSDVALNELNDDSVKRVSVDKELLLKLASFMVTESDTKAVQPEVAF
jgi:ParB-like chromosome segregation protein Spo0J